MKKIALGSTVLRSAPIAFGCMRMAGLEVEKAERIVNLAVEQGIDLFDHADIYGGGESERLFAKVLKRNPGLRGRMLVQSKCGICKGYYDASKEHIWKRWTAFSRGLSSTTSTSCCCTARTR